MNALALAVSTALLSSQSANGQPAALPGASPREGGPLLAQADLERAYDIPAGPLAPALNRFSDVSDLQLIYGTELADDLTTAGVRGTYTPEEALRILLQGAPITYELTDTGAVILRQVAEQGGDGPMQLGPITVEGTGEAPPPAFDPVEGYKADFATTGTRSRLPIKETPSSIGFVTDDVIADTFSRTQGDAMEGVSSVSRANTRLGRSEGLNIRGFRVTTFNGSFNGLKENGLPTSGSFAPDPAFVERYEVLKGPASIVGGASTPGGVINRITKAPGRENFAIVEGQGGSYGFKRGVADLNGVAFEGERLRGRLVAAVEDDGNFVDEVDVRQYSLGPSLELDLFGGTGTLQVSGRYQNFDGSSYPGFPFLANGEAPDIPRERNFGGGSANGASTEFRGGNAQIHYEHDFLDALTFSAKGRYERSDLESLDLYAYQFGGIPLNGNANMYAAFRDTEWETLSGEIYVNKEFTVLDRKHEVLVGIDHRDQTNDFTNGYVYLGFDNIFNPANNFQAPSVATILANPAGNREVTLEQTGLFGQIVVRPTDRLTIVAAGRQDWADLSFLNRNTNVTTEDDPTDFTGRVGVTFAVTPWLNVYGGYQESFEPNAFAVTVGGDLIEPETGESWEVGMKVDALDGRLGGSLALFRTYRQNVASPDPANPGFSIPVGEQRHQGIEADVNGEPIPGLKLSANFSFVDAEITESNIAGFKGNSPFRIPIDYVGRVWGTYTFQSGPLKDFGFGGGVLFHSGFHLDFTETVTSDAYERLDLIAFYRPLEDVEMQLNIRNLTDATFIEVPGSPQAYNQFGAPLSVFGSVRVRF